MSLAHSVTYSHLHHRHCHRHRHRHRLFTCQHCVSRHRRQLCICKTSSVSAQMSCPHFRHQHPRHHHHHHHHHHRRRRRRRRRRHRYCLTFLTRRSSDNRSRHCYHHQPASDAWYIMWRPSTVFMTVLMAAVTTMINIVMVMVMVMMMMMMDQSSDKLAMYCDYVTCC